jgi:phosphopantetheinyl transferase
MPLYLKKNNADGSQIALWQMTESVAELLKLSDASEKMKREVAELRSETRKKEWLTVRILLKDVLKIAREDEIIYDQKGKPHLRNGNGHISFSHTKNFAAIIFHHEKVVGIDIERIHERIETVAPKFVSETEYAFIRKEKKQETLHVIWGVKEVLFKIHGMGGMDFKRHLLVHSFDLKTEGMVNAEIRMEGLSSNHHIHYFFSNSLMVVFGY